MPDPSTSSGSPRAQSRGEWRDEIRQRLAGLHLPPEREAEVVEELSQHLDDRCRELRLGGIEESDAVREALADLDETDLVRELSGVERQQAAEPLAIGGGPGPAFDVAQATEDGLYGRERPGALAGLWHDARFGARLLAKDKSVTLVIVATLAIAIAANTIVFGLTDLLLLRPLPVANASRLVAIFATDERRLTSRDPLSIPQYRDVARDSTSFEGVAAMVPRQLSLTSAGEPRAVGALLATANLFSTLGVDAFSGRTFLPGEDMPGRSNAVVLSHRFWTAYFHADPHILGRTLTLNGVGRTVVGVLTPALEVGSLVQVDVWLPLDAGAVTNRQRDRDLAVYGLLRTGQSIDAANADLATISDRLRHDYPVTDGHVQIRAMSIAEANVSSDTGMLLGLLGIVVGLVLLLACANVGTIMQARATARRREIAVRLALGATRMRLVRQLVSEGACAGLLAGGAGVLLAAAAIPGIKRLTPEPYFQLLAIDTHVLLFALALSLITPMLFGVVPALQASRQDLHEDLKEGSRVGPSQRQHHRRSVLVVTQVAFALTALIISGLIVRTVLARQQVPLGIVADDVLCLRVRFDPPKYVADTSRIAAVDAILARLAGTPGVDAVAASTRVPIFDLEPQRQFTIASRATTADEIPWAVEATMTPGTRNALKLPWLEGRAFTPEDRAGSARVAIVSREAARRYWPGSSAVGQRIALLGGTGESTGEQATIVGVVDDVKSSSLTEPAPPRIYIPLAQRPGEVVVFLVRTSWDTSLMASLVRDAMRAEDADLALSEIRPLASMLDQRLFRPFHMVVALFAGFAFIGLVLAVTGVYGVAAFSAGQRKREIAIRLALGATSGEVARLVVGRTVGPVVIGIVIGAFGGWAVAHAMRRMLFGASVLDPPTYLTVIALLALGGLAASLVPARRAASSDPALVLRQE